MDATTGKKLNPPAVERGSTFDWSVVWNYLTELVEDFTMTEGQKAFMFINPPALITKDPEVYKLRVWLDGFEVTAGWAVLGSKLYFQNPFEAGVEVHVLYSYKTAMDLTGYSARMQIRAGVGQVPICELLSTNATGEAQIILTNPGGIRLLVPETLTRDWTPFTYQYDLELSNDGLSPAYVTRILEGKFRVVPNITELIV